MADRAELQVARLPEAATEEIVARYEKAARLLRAKIKGAIEREALGTARERRKALAGINQILKQLGRETEGLPALAIPGGYENGREIADISIESTLPEVADNLVKADFAGGANLAAVEAMQLAVEQKLDDALQQVGRSAQDVFRRVGLEQVGTGIAGGLSRKETSQAIVKELTEEGVGAFIDRSGKTWKLDTYARMVARTTQREAMSLGTLDRLAQLGIDLVHVSDHNTECEICKEFEDKVYSISGNSDKYPKLIELPPFHPNCKHVIGAARENLTELLEREEEQGAVDAKVTQGEEPGPNDARTVLKNTSTNPQHREMVDHALRSIERVHRYPSGLSMPPTASVVMAKDMSDPASWGEHVVSYLPDEGGGAVPVSAQILVSRTKVEKHNPTVHEAGHFVDSVWLGDVSEPQARFVGRKLHPQWGNERDKAAAWREAVRNSDVGQRVLAHGTAYARDWSEIWARTYEQWIAIRSGDEELRKTQREWVEREKALGQRFISYWDDPGDFEPIAAALDEIFKKAGLLVEAKEDQSVG